MSEQLELWSETWPGTFILEYSKQHVDYRVVCKCGYQSELYPNTTIKWAKDTHDNETGHKSELFKFTTHAEVISG